MMRTLLCLMLASLLLAPVALAQENETNKTPEEGENAWVEDCPPDMMCAMESPSEEESNKTLEGNETGESPTYGDCGAEVCAYDSHTELPPQAETAVEDAKAVPAPALALGLVALAAGALLALVGRRA